jgi:calcineurin-like phosphoesterase family protein
MSNQNYWFCSDHHFWHENIIKYAKRPFKNAEEMNRELIARHNSVVAPNDMVYILGDFAFSKDPAEVIKVIKRLNGQKFYVFGNHDRIMTGRDVTQCFNRAIHGFHEIYVPDDEVIGGKQHVVLCHYPMISWNKAHRGSIQLFGHEHGNLSHIENHQQLDVGVDCWDYYPVSYQQVKKKLATLPKRTISHH